MSSIYPLIYCSSSSVISNSIPPKISITFGKLAKSTATKSSIFKPKVWFIVFIDNSGPPKALSLIHIFSNNYPVLCSVGKLIEVKGYERLIKVHKKLIDNGYLNNLIIVGEGSERGKLENLITYLKCTDTVKLYGYKKNPYVYMNSSDIYVSSSYTEGLPTVLIEAMLLKKPIIATNCTGNNEVLGYGKYGVLTENSEEGLYDAIKDILIKEDCNYFSLYDEAIERFDLDNFKRSIKKNLFK